MWRTGALLPAGAARLSAVRPLAARLPAARVLAVLCLVGAPWLLAACGGTAPERAEDPPGEPNATADLPGEPNAVIQRVVDGDTIVVESEGVDDRVRLIGIDTPESVKPGSPVECYGKEASAYTESLLPEGTEVVLVRDVEVRDRYDRLLAYVYRASDGLFVNLDIVEQGYAQPATYPPNVAHTDEFVAASGEAREADRGLWSACEGELDN
ncbi:MAG: thermonuclease family protein [Microthrixaceae bacterium]